MYGSGCKISTDHAPFQSAFRKEIQKVQMKVFNASSVVDHICAIKATVIDTKCIPAFLVTLQILQGTVALGLHLTDKIKLMKASLN